jgi:peptide/nickel transport system permease protein
MLRYVIRRLLYAIPTLIGVALLTFVLFYAMSSPRQMARQYLGKNPTEAQITKWIEDHGYDKPKHEQFQKHLKELMLLRFGKSDATKEDIWTRIRQGAPASLALGVFIFAVATITELIFALMMSYYRGTYLDLWGTFLCVLLMSVSSLVYIMTGQYIMGKLLKWFPLAGFSGVSPWKFILLPGVIGVIVGLGQGIRLYRTFLLDEVNQDYVRTARAKGVPEQLVMFKHVLKNAAIPILTSLILSIPFLFMGSLLLESFFGIPGLGGITFDAINSQDFAVVRAMVFLSAILYIIGSIMTDVSYALVDPRVRLE